MLIRVLREYLRPYYGHTFITGKQLRPGINESGAIGKFTRDRERLPFRLNADDPIIRRRKKYTSNNHLSANISQPRPITIRRFGKSDHSSF